ncbi:MAG: hypothetical protein JRI89_17665 [Deltaproteobacteria bacterium]|nr:hypothetical protein [Deltaproteobacteria bacterium]
MKVHLITDIFNQAGEGTGGTATTWLPQALACIVPVDIYFGKQLRHDAIVVLAAGSAFRSAASNFPSAVIC